MIALVFAIGVSSVRPVRLVLLGQGVGGWRNVVRSKRVSTNGNVSSAKLQYYLQRVTGVRCE